MTIWTVVSQASLSMGFFRPEYWSGLPYPPPGDRPDPRIKPDQLPEQKILLVLLALGKLEGFQKFCIRNGGQRPKYTFSIVSQYT